MQEYKITWQRLKEMEKQALVTQLGQGCWPNLDWDLFDPNNWQWEEYAFNDSGYDGSIQLYQALKKFQQTKQDPVRFVKIHRRDYGGAQEDWREFTP